MIFTNELKLRDSLKAGSVPYYPNIRKGNLDLVPALTRYFRKLNHCNIILDRNCDFLTADSTAYTHFFRVKSINFVQISEFTFEKGADRPIYLVRIMDQ